MNLESLGVCKLRSCSVRSIDPLDFFDVVVIYILIKQICGFSYCFVVQLLTFFFFGKVKASSDLFH